MAEKDSDSDDECLPKCEPKPKEIYPEDHVCPVDINPCTLLEDASKKPGASKPQTCMDNKDELDPKIRLKREHELACRLCPKRSCHDTDMLNLGGKCEEDDPKKKKKKY